MEVVRPEEPGLYFGTEGMRLCSSFRARCDLLLA